jgi:HlyD family secretion protein
MKLKRNALLGIAALLALALLAWAFMPSPAEVDVAAVTQGRFERSVLEDGKTRVRDRFAVSTPLTGRVARIDLRQGDAVQRGDTVAMVWPAASALLDERSRAEQAARVGAVQAALARAHANGERALAALEQARAELKRSEALAREGFVSPNQNETGRLSVRLREKELDAARQDEDAARHELDQARLALKLFNQPAPDGPQRAFAITAPVSGKVLKILQQSEGAVVSGTPLMELGDPSQLEVEADLLTEDAAQVRPGTPVRLSNWGGPEVLTGQVRLVEPAAFTKVSALGVQEQRVNAIIDITTPRERWAALGDGYKVDVSVLVQVAPNVIKVPVSALFPQGARSALYVLDGGRARLREVEVVARNGQEAWVKSGVAVGAQVITYPDAKLKDNDKVKLRAPAR